jgi:RNA polymerase sigma-70 factor (ECF subfamily)
VTEGAEAAVADAFRDEWGRIVATLIRTTGDWDLAEECAQDAFTEAWKRWGRDGVPRRPGAWLTTVARNRALDRLRRRAAEGPKLKEAAILRSQREGGGGQGAGGGNGDGAGGDGGPGDDSGIGDDRLKLIFTCCHPALPLEARVALTLRTLAGLTTAEIAKAFLVPEATMAKRLVRAKQKIANAAIAYRVPPAPLLAERTSGVLAVLYLLFNEGYAASGGANLVRESLCLEAVRLARLMCRLMPGDAEVGGLLALMLFHHARRASRLDGHGELVTLEDQDRRVWDRAEIDEATAVLGAAPGGGRVGPYQLQAAIAGCHATAPEPSATDWPEIAGLYKRLAAISPSPVIELNRAVAVAMADGPGAGLALVDELGGAGVLQGYYLLPAVRADLQRRLGRQSEAAASYREALTLAPTDAERRFLARRLAQVTGEATTAAL